MNQQRPRARSSARASSGKRRAQLHQQFRRARLPQPEPDPFRVSVRCHSRGSGSSTSNSITGQSLLRWVFFASHQVRHAEQVEDDCRRDRRRPSGAPIERKTPASPRNRVITSTRNSSTPTGAAQRKCTAWPRASSSGSKRGTAMRSACQLVQRRFEPGEVVRLGPAGRRPRPC